MKIKTDNTHKSAARVEFAKNVKTKVTTTLALGSAVLIMFSGCQSLANEKNNTTIQTPSTTFEDTLKNFGSTTKNNENYTIPQQSTTTPYTELSSIPTTQNNESTTKTEVEATNSVATYEQLLAELNEVISNKGFNLEARKLILETFEALYENYDGWKELYKSLPPKEEFIRDKLINSLNYVNGINVYEYGTKDAENVLQKYGYSDFTTANNEITITTSQSGTNLEKFLHEMIHVEQNVEENSSRYKQNYFYDEVDLSKLFREGEATFNQVFVSQMSQEKNHFTFRQNQKGDIIYYGKTVTCGYSDYLYIYNNLVNLVGYENLNKVKGNNIFKQISNFLEEKYGHEGSKEILSAIAYWESTRPIEETKRSDEAYKSAVELQKIFNKYMLQDIYNLRGNNEVQEYSNRYKKYKAIVLPQVIDKNGNDISYEAFETAKIDDALKIKESTIQEYQER